MSIKNGYFLLPFIGLAVFLSIMPLSGSAPILIVLSGLLLGIVIVSIFAPDDFNFLLHLFLIAFGVRIFLCFLFYNLSFVLPDYLSPGFFPSNDGWSYSHQGWQLCQFAERGIVITKENFLLNPNVITLSGNITSYDYFNSFVYSVVGYSPLSLFFMHSMAGSLAALFIYLIAKELFSKNVARISVLFAFFWPSFIMWSTQNFKDSVLVMFISILIWSLMHMNKYFCLGFLLFSIASVWALFELSRPYAVLVLCGICFVILFLSADFFIRNKALTIMIFGFLLIICIVFLKDRIFSYISRGNPYGIAKFSSLFEFLDFHRGVRAYGNLQFLKDVDISSFGRSLSFLPLGLLYAFFAPFPWQLGNIMQAMVIPETIVFYLLVPCTLRGVIFACKKRFNQSLLLLVIIAVIMFFLALIEGNSGTLLRHRYMTFSILFIFTAVGISLKKGKLGWKQGFYT